jgi:hypothetical protein
MLQLVQEATASPTRCALCQSHEGPFIDTGVEFLGYGWVFICTSSEKRSGCVRQMGRLDGMIDAEIVDEAMTQLDAMRARVEELEQELEESKVVPMSEVIDHLTSAQHAREES